VDSVKGCEENALPLERQGFQNTGNEVLAHVLLCRVPWFK